MIRRRNRTVFIALFFILAASSPVMHTAAPMAAARTAAFLQLPLRFERSPESSRAAADFTARGAGYGVYLSGGDATIVLKAPGSAQPEMIAMRLVGGRDGVAATAGAELPGRSNHVIGRDSRAWRRGVTAHASVTYAGVYPGVDLVYYGNQRQLEYDFIVAPGASPADIAFAIEGAETVRVDDGGNVVITTQAGSLTHRAPLVYQEQHGVRLPIDGRYDVRRDGTIGFAVGAYDEQLSLVIDPVLSYATYLGGSNEERINGVAADAEGNIVIVGDTWSADLPLVNPLQPRPSGLGEAFVAKLNAAGSALVYATYFGGTHEDSAKAVALDAEGAVYVTGATMSVDFPVFNGFQLENRGTFDAFVFKFTADGSPAYSTLLGGRSEDYGNGIVVGADGRAHIGGSTLSADFPTVNPLQPLLGGHPLFRTVDGGGLWTGENAGLRASGVTAIAIDPFSPDTVYAGTQMEGVFKSIDGGLTWAPAGSELTGWQVTSLAVGNAGPAPAVYAGTQGGMFRSVDGGATWQFLPFGSSVAAIAVDPARPGVVYAGLNSGDVTGVIVSTDGGDSWSPTGLNAPVHALALGGTTLYAATAEGMFTSANGASWVPANAGLPGTSVNLVSVDPANPSIAYAGGYDGLFKTTTGGASWEPDPVFIGVPIAAIAVAPSDSLTMYVSTYWWGSAVTYDGGVWWQPTHSDSVPAAAIAVHPQNAGTAYLGVLMNRDGFVATVSADGSTLEYSTYFGGTSHEAITDIALDGNESKIFVGTTSSADLPVLNALQEFYGGVQDVFIAKIASGGSAVYSTYLGGPGFESAPKVAVDANGRAHVAGLTWSYTFPVVNAAQPQPGGGYADAFVSVLYPEGSSFVYSTFLGGSALESDTTQTPGPDVAVTASGETFVTGSTMSADFPTTPDAAQGMHGGQVDAFVTKFDAQGGLRYSTFLGGAGNDLGRAVAIVAQESVIIAGYTSSANFPVRNPLQPVNAGTDDGFVARLDMGAPPDPTDTVPPVTSVLLSGAPGEAGWYRSPVEVTLSATDEAGSGVALTQYRIDNGPLQTYAGPFIVSAEGLTGISAFSTDLAGNVEDAAPATPIMIDTEPPSVYIASPESREYVYTDTIAISAAVGDGTSGLAGPAAYMLDGSPFSGSTIDLSTLSLGPHTLTVTAVDVAGNSTETSVTFHVVLVRDTVINVPAEQPTIQAAIFSAVSGDTVVVAPGTYVERINFMGKAITVRSEQGPDGTIIDGGGAGPVVTFQSGETRASVLRGFTVRGGYIAHSGGGIYIWNASPTVEGNVIADNRACSGAGIYSQFGSPLVANNRITRNASTGCTGGWGMGVYVGGNSSAEIVDNEISENRGEAASGGGLALFAAGNATVSGNVIKNNSTSGPAGCGYGGGIRTANFSQVRLINNLIVGNSACVGAGIDWVASSGVNVWVNNTVAANSASVSWPAVHVSGYDARHALHNNIFAASAGPAFYCDNTTGVSLPVLSSNDVFSGDGAAYGGTCGDQTGIDGNISADPKFLDAAGGDFRVTMTSPAIDTGNGSAPYLPAVDVAGGQRVVDGDGDGDARVDIGALEYRNRAPVADAGPDQRVACGPDCRASITLVGSGSDADGDALSFTWTGPFGTVSGATLNAKLPLGANLMTLTVDDGQGGFATDTVVVTVVDAAPPVIASVTASPAVLTRVNHEMVPVTVSVSVTDLCDPSVDCRIVAVTSNEPEQGAGAGDSFPDWEITGDLTVNLRAERLGKGDGRVYTIVVECSDDGGNRSTSAVTVTVPR